MAQEVQFDSREQEFLESAMEASTAELLDVIGGRKEFFNTFYESVARGMKSGGVAKFLKAVAAYRDRNIAVLSAPYLTKYTIFALDGRDARIIFEITNINEKDVAKAIDDFRKDILTGCKLKGYTTMRKPFENLIPFRLILLLIMRFFLETGNKKGLQEACAYMGYSMFYTIFQNFFPYGVREETMRYTMTSSLTNKHKIKNMENIDELLRYGNELCVDTYKQRIMECDDYSCAYIIGQFKSRLRGHMRSIANKYHEDDKAKNAIFTSQLRLENEEGNHEFVDRPSRSTDIEQLAQQYTNRFFQNPIDDVVITICVKFNKVSRNELKMALTSLKADVARVPEVKAFYAALFHLYLEETGSQHVDVHTKFLATMDDVYKKGHSKNQNVIMYKEMLDRWLTATSKTYREVSRLATLNDFRKALYQYFVYSVGLRA